MNNNRPDLHSTPQTKKGLQRSPIALSGGQRAGYGFAYTTWRRQRGVHSLRPEVVSKALSYLQGSELAPICCRAEDIKRKVCRMGKVSIIIE